MIKIKDMMSVIRKYNIRIVRNELEKNITNCILYNRDNGKDISAEEVAKKFNTNLTLVKQYKENALERNFYLIMEDDFEAIVFDFTFKQKTFEELCELYYINRDLMKEIINRGQEVYNIEDNGGLYDDIVKGFINTKEEALTKYPNAINLNWLFAIAKEDTRYNKHHQRLQQKQIEKVVEEEKKEEGKTMKKEQQKNSGRKYNKKNEKMIHKNEKEIAECLKSMMSKKDIADKFETTPYIVNKVAIKYNLRQQGHNALDQKVVNFILEHPDMTYEELAKALSKSTSTIHKIKNKMIVCGYFDQQVVPVDELPVEFEEDELLSEDREELEEEVTLDDIVLNEPVEVVEEVEDVEEDDISNNDQMTISNDIFDNIALRYGATGITATKLFTFRIFNESEDVLITLFSGEIFKEVNIAKLQQKCNKFLDRYAKDTSLLALTENASIAQVTTLIKCCYERNIPLTLKYGTTEEDVVIENNNSSEICNKELVELINSMKSYKMEELDPKKIFVVCSPTKALLYSNIHKAKKAFAEVMTNTDDKLMFIKFNTNTKEVLGNWN